MARFLVFSRSPRIFEDLEAQTILPQNVVFRNGPICLSKTLARMSMNTTSHVGIFKVKRCNFSNHQREKKQEISSFVRNPSPPKVQRRGSLTTVSVGGGRSMFPAVVICTFCISARCCPNAPFRIEMATPSAPLGISFGQHGPMCPNFNPLGPQRVCEERS